MTLTVIWLVTAAAALILTVVYFERLQKLYDKVDRENIQMQAARNTSVNADAAVNETGSDTRVSLAGEGGNPGKITADAGNADGGPGKIQASEGNAGGDPGQITSDAENAGGDQGKIPVNEGNAGSDPGNISAGDGSGPADINEGNTGAGNGMETQPPVGDSIGEAAGGIGEETQGTTDRSDNYDHSLGLDPTKPIIALSFDDGPSSYTERIVAALQANHVEATFFMVGYNVREFKDTVRLVYDSGMQIGNHTSDHKNLSKLKKDEIKSQVFDNEDLINSVVPVGRIVVRPPYGAINSTVKSVVNRPMFNWSVDSEDWKTRNADSIVAQIKQDAKDGYVILMHDLYESTAEAAERIIPWLLDQGYQVTSIEKMFKARGVITEDGELYRMAQPAELR